MLETGQTAPDFRLPGTAGADIDDHTLSEYVDRGWSVVLVFYPFDFHPACVSQWCTLRDADWLTVLDDTVVVGVGADSVYAHRQFAREYNVDFPLLSDSDGRVAEAYGVPRTGVRGPPPGARDGAVRRRPRAPDQVRVAWRRHGGTGLRRRREGDIVSR
ncbi:redoxin domain-containing protein [Salinigranum sp.]|uniref:redoxin domain-containing protein n=1 Tax=Salinigranum sp. TaxID=1966351 RepID=UPI003566E42C